MQRSGARHCRETFSVPMLRKQNIALDQFRKLDVSRSSSMLLVHAVIANTLCSILKVLEKVEMAFISFGNRRFKTTRSALYLKESPYRRGKWRHLTIPRHIVNNDTWNGMDFYWYCSKSLNSFWATKRWRPLFMNTCVFRRTSLWKWAVPSNSCVISAPLVLIGFLAVTTTSQRM